jgi:hypothetical protein
LLLGRGSLREAKPLQNLYLPLSFEGEGIKGVRLIKNPI